MTLDSSEAVKYAPFLDDHQRTTAEAAMARIIPTDDTPGAREANTIEFLDRYLSGVDFIYAKPDGSGFEKLTGKRGEAWRQRVDILREKYAAGLREMDRVSRRRFDADFVDLDPEQQDDVLTELERPVRDEEAALATAQAVSGYGSPVEPALQQTSAETELDFFPLLVFHTRQGFYADPIYGGNRARVGWQLIGFPGPSSLAEVHSGRYSVIEYFAEGEAERYKEAVSGAQAQS
jgi:gluconate 2-dehydrogenase gamma chain